MSSSWDTYDAEYRPDDAWDWLTDEHPKRVLVVGVPDDDTADRFLATFDDVRWTSDKLAVALVHRGAYLLRRGHRRDALVVLTGKDPESPTQERLRNSDGHVSFANEIVERTWPASTPLAPGTDLQAGDLVQVGGDRLGRVQDVRRLRTGHEVDVDLGAELATEIEQRIGRLDRFGQQAGSDTDVGCLRCRMAYASTNSGCSAWSTSYSFAYSKAKWGRLPNSTLT